MVIAACPGLLELYTVILSIARCSKAEFAKGMRHVEAIFTWRKVAHVAPQGTRQLRTGTSHCWTLSSFSGTRSYWKCNWLIIMLPVKYTGVNERKHSIEMYNSFTRDVSFST